MCVCVCVCVCERELVLWFMRTKICIITWVLQHEGGLGGHCLYPRKPKGLKKRTKWYFFENLKMLKVSCEGQV